MGYINTSKENIERIKSLAEKHTLKEVAQLTGRSTEGIRDFLIRHDALPENRKVRYRKAVAKKYTVKLKKCVDCGKELFWTKIYTNTIRCQKCGHKKYFDDLRASKPVTLIKVKQVKIKPVRIKKPEPIKIKKCESDKEVWIDERLRVLDNSLKKLQKELNFNVC